MPEIQVRLVGKAHEDAKRLLVELNTGVADYIAYHDGTICTPSRSLVGTLPERIVPISTKRSSWMAPHGYTEDKSCKKHVRLRRRRK